MWCIDFPKTLEKYFGSRGVGKNRDCGDVRKVVHHMHHFRVLLTESKKKSGVLAFLVIHHPIHHIHH
jgi:hypothetical protein